MNAIPIERQDCHRELLARGVNSAVERCACGVLHVTVGALTMRFTREAAAELAQTLEEALGQLQLRDCVENGGLLLPERRTRKPS